MNKQKSKEVTRQTFVTLICSPPWGLELHEQGLQPSLGEQGLVVELLKLNDHSRQTTIQTENIYLRNITE